MTLRSSERLGRRLDPSVDEARLQRLWRGSHRVMASRMRRRAQWRASLVAVAFMVVATGGWRWWANAGPSRAALTLVDGAPLRAVRAGAVASVERFSDASHVRVAPGGALRPTHSSAERVAWRLERGTAAFEVTPGLGRAWSVEADGVIVRVVGTAFRVERRDTGVYVAVSHGVVHVESSHLPTGMRELRAGDDLFVATRAPAPARVVEVSEPTIVAPAGAPAVGNVPRYPAPPRATAPRTPRWQTLAEAGAHRDAYDALHDAPVPDLGATPPRELLLRADVARLSGHPVDAVAPLEAYLRHHADDADAPLAAITLARIFAGPLADPARSRAAYERARSLGVPAALRDEVDAALGAVP